MEALDAVLPAGVHERLRSEDVCLQKHLRRLNRAIHVTLRREVHDDIWPLLLKERVHRRPVADIRPNETEAGRKAPILQVHQRRQCRKISRIGQLAQTNNPVPRMCGQHVIDEIAPDKPAPPVTMMIIVNPSINWLLFAIFSMPNRTLQICLMFFPCIKVKGLKNKS